ncbi:hypothetical protein HOLleu_38077 [Holothuria leucospilota]|uniref:Uncharacterized protein n=1 Tax=Holothuria leucospilota TaxID=206669 RepID=A0A9Q1BCU0_HOLLE|nr:hypothetical protein HOLleu_38077 [Holothuria leucospilota]
MVPHQLYNFLAWTVGSLESPVTNRRVEIDPETHRKLLAISQDIIYVASKGKEKTPKHMSLAMSVRHMTGSAQLIGLSNSFSYCVSNSVTLNHYTAIAQQEMRRGEDAVPPNIHPRCNITLVWDNNDFGEETLSDTCTTHNTNGIIVQPLLDCQQVEEGPEIPLTTKRTRERTTKPPPSRIHTMGERRQDHLQYRLRFLLSARIIFLY